MTTYKIVRFFKRALDDSRVKSMSIIKTGLTLEEAQAHCQDPETASNTATSDAMKRYTAKHGDWFDGYDEE